MKLIIVLLIGMFVGYLIKEIRNRYIKKQLLNKTQSAIDRLNSDPNIQKLFDKFNELNGSLKQKQELINKAFQKQILENRLEAERKCREIDEQALRDICKTVEE